MRTILHSDLNNFYASVECVYDPELKEIPVAVCRNRAVSETEIRRYGVMHFVRYSDTTDTDVDKCSFHGVLNQYNEYVYV